MIKYILTLTLLSGCSHSIIRQQVREPIVEGSRIKYPDRMASYSQKAAFLLRCKEKNRMLHNLVGKWFREGLSQDEYDNGIDAGKLLGKSGHIVTIPQRIKNQINNGNYQNKISKAQWHIFLNQVFEPNLVDVELAFLVVKDSLKIVILNDNEIGL